MRNNNIKRKRKKEKVTGTERRVSNRALTLTERRVRDGTPALTKQFVFQSFDSRNSNLYKETERHHAFEKLILVTLV